MKEKAWIGIDPGASGAIAWITKDESHATSFVNESYMNSLLKVWAFEFEIQIALLERVHSMPKQGVSSMFKFGTNYGIWIGLLTALSIPFRLVNPREWQKGLIVKSDGDNPKERSLTVARRMFPNVDLHRKKDHNKADALLMAVYARSLSK